jgi:hypothetical protein
MNQNDLSFPGGVIPRASLVIPSEARDLPPLLLGMPHYVRHDIPHVIPSVSEGSLRFLTLRMGFLGTPCFGMTRHSTMSFFPRFYLTSYCCCHYGSEWTGENADAAIGAKILYEKDFTVSHFNSVPIADCNARWHFTVAAKNRSTLNLYVTYASVSLFAGHFTGVAADTSFRVDENFPASHALHGYLSFLRSWH